MIGIRFFRDPPFKADDPAATLADAVDTLCWTPNFTAAVNEDFKGYHPMLTAFFGLLDGQATGMPTIDDGVAAAAAALPVAARGQRVYYEITPAPHAAGQGSFIHELLLALGLVNVIDDPALGPFPRLNPELVVRADPDLIMVSQGGAADMARRPGWAGLRALREGRVCEFNAAQRDILVRPGPRMPEAARLMADCAARRPLQNR